MNIPRFKEEKYADEKRVLSFDFTDDLDAGETISGVVVVSVSVARGNDAAPNAILNGVSAIDATSKIVLQGVQGGIKGAEYLIKVIAPTNNPKKVLVLQAVLPVV